MATLDTLPLEVQFEIFSYLLQPLSSHAGISPVPVTYEEQLQLDYLRHDRVQLMQHPYNHLAATCQNLRTSVEALCLHLLTTGSEHGRSEVHGWKTAIALAAAKGVVPKKPPCVRIRYLMSTFRKCIFCGKKSQRRAAFNRFMWCDAKCDVKQYGRLIVGSISSSFTVYQYLLCNPQSKSEAASKHQVQEIHWRTPQLVFPGSAWKPLRMTLYNTALCSSTTLLVQKDVLELADYIKTHDPRGEKLKLARKQIRDKARSYKGTASLEAT
jgi:hypothetical protein